MASKVLEDISEVKPDKIGGYVFIKGKRHNEGIKLPLINSKAGSATGNIRNMFYNTKEVPGVETLRKMTKEEVVKTMVQLHVENTKLQTSRQSYALESSYLNRRIDMLEARLDYSAAVLGLRSWSKMKTRRQRVGQKYKAEREKLKKIK